MPKSKTKAVPPRAPEKPVRKIDTLMALLRRPQGAGLPEMIEATGWQAHSIRGAMSGAIGKTLGLKVTSTKQEGVRTYRIEATT
jgi:hypothetical protein